jgi:hypothetical protein
MTIINMTLTFPSLLYVPQLLLHLLILLSLLQHPTTLSGTKQTTINIGIIFASADEILGTSVMST